MKQSWTKYVEMYWLQAVQKHTDLFHAQCAGFSLFECRWRRQPLSPACLFSKYLWLLTNPRHLYWKHCFLDRTKASPLTDCQIDFFYKYQPTIFECHLVAVLSCHFLQAISGTQIIKQVSHELSPHAPETVEKLILLVFSKNSASPSDSFLCQ